MAVTFKACSPAAYQLGLMSQRFYNLPQQCYQLESKCANHNPMGDISYPNPNHLPEKDFHVKEQSKSPRWEPKMN